MKKFLFLFLVCLLTACYPVVTYTPVIKLPKIVLTCSINDTATIKLSSDTPIFLPLLEVPRFPDGSVPIRYQFKDFTGLSEPLELTWCPITATLEYSLLAGGTRLKTSL